jgi:hypothetical protein
MDRTIKNNILKLNTDVTFNPKSKVRKWPCVATEKKQYRDNLSINVCCIVTVSVLKRRRLTTHDFQRSMGWFVVREKHCSIVEK